MSRRQKNGSTDVKRVDLPRNGRSMGYNDAYAMEYVDTFKAGDKITIHFMPPGAANLPVQYIFVPDSVSKRLLKK